MNVKKANISKKNLPLLGLGALLVDQGMASMRSELDDSFSKTVDPSKALDQISSNESAASEAFISESLKALNDLVQSELALESRSLKDPELAYGDDGDLMTGETTPPQTLAQEAADKAVLVAQADIVQESVSDAPNTLLAQLSQAAPTSSSEPSKTKPIDQPANTDDDGGLLWLVGGAGFALALSGDGSENEVIPSNIPGGQPGPSNPGGQPVTPAKDGTWDIADGEDPDRPDDSVVQLIDGTVNLNSSLSGLSAMGIDFITGETGTNVLVTGGIDGFDLDATDLRFADGVDGENDLNVALQLSADDQSDLGTVNLNNSLSGLSAMGIDYITGETGTDVLITGGIDGFDLDANDLRFADGQEGGEEDLDVALQLSDADQDPSGTVNLSTDNLSKLSDMGIDFITGADGTSVVINDLGDITWQELVDLGLNFSDGGEGDSDLLVTLNLDAESSILISTEAENALRDMGIDMINGPDFFTDLGDAPLV